MDKTKAMSHADTEEHVEEQNLGKITNNDGWHVTGLKIWRFLHHILLPFNNFHLSTEYLGRGSRRIFKAINAVR